jgi:hypothetical protein
MARRVFKTEIACCRNRDQRCLRAMSPQHDRRMLRLLPIAFALITFIHAPAPARAQECALPDQLSNERNCWWATYLDPYSGATLDYPADLLRPEPGYADGAGHRFVSADGKVTVSIWGSWITGGLTPTEAMATDIYRSGFEAVTMKDVDDLGYRIAGRHGAHRFLKRVRWSGKDGHIAETMCISWPADRDASWTMLAEKIAGTLREGRGWARNPRLSDDQKVTLHDGTCLGL